MQNKSENLFQKGIESFRKKNFIEAEKCFEELKSDHPTNKDILKNLSLCYFQNKKFKNCENVIKLMFDLGLKEKKLIEFLLLVLKKQDDAGQILKLISEEKNNIDQKYELLETFERPSITMNTEETENYRSSSIEKVNKAILNNNLKLNVDSQFLDPPLFYYSYDKKDNLTFSKKLNELFKKTYYELSQKIEINKFENKKIKIGFISQYFKKHTISKLFKGLICNLDNSLFDTNVFYLDNEKGIDDEFLENEKANKIKIFKLPRLFNEKVNFILDQNLDIIFYPDIGMSTQLYYLTFLRLGKKQITSWGHPETTGNYNIDYFLSSKLLEIDFIEAQKHYSEELLLSDYLPMYFFKPKIKKIDDKELLSNNIYSCPQTLFKLHPDFDEIIIKILQNDNKAKIYFINDKEKCFSKKILERLKKKIPNKIDQIYFLDKMTEEEYINHCGRASVLLDPLYFGAGNSFHESMFYGTPTVSMPTKYLRSKIVEGAYKQMRIGNPPVVNDVDDYVSLAIEIANTKPKQNLERKKYYSELAIQNLYENKEALKSFEKILLKVAS
tara:strand:- start:41 stop:1708 length:1668 start_codon:yes stop_codon:yes gene_type:complete